LKKIIILMSALLSLLNATGIEHKFFFSNDLKIKTIDSYSENIQTIKRLPRVSEIKNNKFFNLSIKFVTTNKDSEFKTKINNLFQDEHKYVDNSKELVIKPGNIYKIEITHTDKRFVNATVEKISEYKNEKTNDIFIRINKNKTYTILNYKKTLHLTDNITLKKDFNYLQISIKEIKKTIK